MKQALISSAAAILIAGLGTVGVGWYLFSGLPRREEQRATRTPTPGATLRGIEGAELDRELVLARVPVPDQFVGATI
jgi:hypothetical protein